jgi:hypothetical protein
MDEPVSQDPVLRPFADTFRDLGGGIVADEAAEQLAEIVRAVTATGKKGTLTIKVTVGRVPKVADAIAAEATVTSRLPEGGALSSIFYPDDKGNLHRDHPRQATLFTRPSVVAEPDARISDGNIG